MAQVDENGSLALTIRYKTSAPLTGGGAYLYVENKTHAAFPVAIVLPAATTSYQTYTVVVPVSTAGAPCTAGDWLRVWVKHTLVDAGGNSTLSIDYLAMPPVAIAYNSRAFCTERQTIPQKGGLTTLSIVAGGTGYTPGAVVLTVVQSGASLGTINCTDSAGGIITSINSVNVVGTGYYVATPLTTTGGGGNGCTVNLTVICNAVLDTNLSLGGWIYCNSATNATLTINNPTNPQQYQDVTYEILKAANNLNITWGKLFKAPAATTAVTASKRVIIKFRWNGTYYVQDGTPIEVAL